MKIKSKLLISNVIMLFLPIIISVVFAAVLFVTFISKFWMPLETMYKDQNGIYSARGIIYAFGDVVDGKNLIVEKNESEFYTYDARLYSTMNEPELHFTESDIAVLENELNRIGYHFKISSDDFDVYSNLSDSDKVKLEKLLKDTNVYDQQNYIITQDKYSTLKATFSDSNIPLEIYAINYNDNMLTDETSNYIERFVNPVITYFIITILLTILVISYGLSVFFKRSIVRPLNKIIEGTKEIASGNLDYDIEYKKDDEFGELVKEFNNMRVHLKDSIDKRKELEEYRRNMIAGISHDLRTPLTSIIGYSEGLKDGIATTDEKRAKYYESIHTRALDMQHLVSTLTSLYLLSNNTVTYNFEVVDLYSFLSQRIEGYSEEANVKQLNIKLINNAINRKVKIDKNELSRVFINIFENSYKYSGKEMTDIFITLSNVDNNLCIKVKDNGVGVKEEALNKIFDSFYREDESRNLKQNSHGLGLSIVKQIITLHNGSIEARSKNGLEIIIMLPIYDGE